MPLGADHIEATGRKRLFLQPGHLAGDGIALCRGKLAIAGRILKPHIQIATKLDVGAAPGHVGGDGDRPGTPASAMIFASSAWKRAFSTLCAIFRFFSTADSASTFRW